MMSSHIFDLPAGEVLHLTSHHLGAEGSWLVLSMGMGAICSGVKIPDDLAHPLARGLRLCAERSEREAGRPHQRRTQHEIALPSGEVIAVCTHSCPENATEVRLSIEADGLCSAVAMPAATATELSRVLDGVDDPHPQTLIH